MTAPREHSALFQPGDKVTITAGAPVIAGSPVTTGGAQCGDASTDVAGIADTTAATGSPFGVFRVGVHVGTASGAITKGDPLCTAAASAVGQPARLRKMTSGDPAASRIGRAWSTAADGAPVTYALFGV